jgi:hypothetical protein
VAGFIPDELTVFIASLKGRAFSPLANAAIARIRSILGAS